MINPLQVARVWGFAIAALPDILNLTIVLILLYAAVISCGPIFNELLWTPDDADRPPIEGRKWSDFDKPMQDILRTYKNGDVAPSGDHIEGWNRCTGHTHFCLHLYKFSLSRRAMADPCEKSVHPPNVVARDIFPLF